MKILVTSGGTKVAIDPVRHITNMSNGTFGSKIATELLRLGHTVEFFHAKRSKTPFSITEDFHGTKEDRLAETFERIRELNRKHGFCYIGHEYETFDDYASGLERLIREKAPDVIILAAAVSDYLTDPLPTKIRSAKGLSVRLIPAQKVIASVRGWAPAAFLVGFKLLVNSTPEELYAAARKSITDNDCDLVVANDLTTLRAGSHKIMLVGKNPAVRGGAVKIEMPEDTPEKMLVGCLTDKLAGRNQ